jgi:hypothetical protein
MTVKILKEICEPRFYSKNTPIADKDKVQEVAGIPTNQRYDMYMGLPALVGKSRTNAFKGIKERVWKRLQDWKIKFLSQAGREILLKAVVQAIPTYCMSVFKLPKALCSEINSMMAKIFWGHKDRDNRIHWKSWTKLCFSKSQGGMGFRDLSVFNKALLAKQVWRLWKIPDSLTARIMKAKYFPDCSVLDASLGKKPSFAWRSIQSSSDLVKEGLVWRVGNGKNIRIWKDRWLYTPSTFRVQSVPRLLADTATVSQLIDVNSKWWNIELLEQLFTKEETIAIKSIPISATDQADRLIWRGTVKGCFSVRSAYYIQKEAEALQQAGGSRSNNKVAVWKTLWQLQLPNSEKHFLWRACHEILPTRDNLCSRKITMESSCPICVQEPETTIHALWTCLAARDVWCVGEKFFQKSSIGGPTFLKLVEELIRICSHAEFAQFVSTAWRIWLRRNEVLHGGAFLHPSQIVKNVSQAGEKFQEVLAGRKPQQNSNEDISLPTWTAPPHDCLKANWDAGFDRKQGKMGLGVVIRDQRGKMWASKCQTREGYLDSTTGEAMAALMAAELCAAMGIRKVV